MNIKRSCGVLLHPLSLQGPWLSGTLGTEAFRFVDFLATAGVRWWQILPLGPTAYGDSPYQSPSAFAGNPYFISPEILHAQGLLTEDEVAAMRCSGSAGVDYGTLFVRSADMLHIAWQTFKKNGGKPGSVRPRAKRTGELAWTMPSAEGFEAFRASQSSWLEDYALFMAIKECHGYAPWNAWPESLHMREPAALASFAESEADRIQRIEFTQYLFHLQWSDLRAYAHGKGVGIIGDIPIFAAYDSADVWAHPELFELDAHRMPRRVAGVPPDYFTATGQLWGNPLYDWVAHERDCFAWWKARVRHALEYVDMLRIDHFRGFEAYWAVPAEADTAIGGTWEKAPGHALFSSLRESLGEVPIIAEDLGFITPEVIELRDRFGFPGMRILQFAFESDTESQDYPHTYPRQCIVYTGTHDNDTARGWFQTAAPKTRQRALAYLHGSSRTFAWDMIRGAWASPAMLAIAPMQDFLDLGSEARLNRPGTTGGWWQWRMPAQALNGRLAARIRTLTKLYFRG
ncbi:MAG: 4-alpha-glucanotransferase [Spirochaetaceae bacterium]|nr:4-alpha-glucanotransferase [Spirochaetaceae bacterium]